MDNPDIVDYMCHYLTIYDRYNLMLTNKYYQKIIEDNDFFVFHMFRYYTSIIF